MNKQMESYNVLTENKWNESMQAIAISAWETWTKNGLDLDEEGQNQTMKHAMDMTNNAWNDGMNEQQWLDAVISMLIKE